MAEKKLSAKQQEILDYIKEETIKKGYPPTVRDICEAVNLKSTSSVHAHLSTLERNGLIRRDPTKPRAIEIIDNSFQMVRQEMTSIPIVGQVAAGQPILAEENISGYFPLPVEYVPNADTFVLKVKGDSMINAGIHSGDSIFVQSCNSAHNGDIVVALIDDSATVKTFYKEKDHIRLQPENDTMEPIIVKECTILGKVFGVFRLYHLYCCRLNIILKNSSNLTNDCCCFYFTLFLNTIRESKYAPQITALPFQSFCRLSRFAPNHRTGGSRGQRYE